MRTPLFPSYSFALAAAAAFASLLAFSALKTPVPGSDEPHYLTKARHYWQPDWCDRDLFLRSADAHVVFYQTVGALTQVVSLAQTAWIGRVLAFALIAVGWTAMAGRLFRTQSGQPDTAAVIWGMWVYLFVSTWGSLSREWIIEGVEAKVFAYGFVFAGLAFVFDRRWLRGAAALGAAASFHPIVGGWSALCAAIAAAVDSWRPAREQHAIASDSASPPAAGRSSLGTVVMAGIVFALCAAPGLWPALALLGEESPAAVKLEADSIQVFGRLAHHLNPRRFEPAGYVLYAALLLAWLVLRKGARLDGRERFFAWFVGGSLLIAGAGLALGWNARPPIDMAGVERPLAALQTKFLKFYPFRLFDAVLPIGVALVSVGWGRRLCRAGEVLRSSKIAPFGLWCLFGAAFAGSLLVPSIHRNPSGLTPRQLADFKDVCAWIRERTPPGSLFFTPAGKAPFKWYAERAEWFSYKDCPQDAASLVEWNRRLVYVRGWIAEHPSRPYSRADLAELGRATEVDYLLAMDGAAFEEPPVYQNASFRVYRVMKETGTTAAAGHPKP